MPTVPKKLGELNPGAATLTALYTCPAGTFVSRKSTSLVVANRSVTPTNFRVSVAVAGAVDGLTQYIAYDALIGANDVVNFDEIIALSAGDIVRVYATLATLTFTLFGEEQT